MISDSLLQEISRFVGTLRTCDRRYNRRCRFCGGILASNSKLVPSWLISSLVGSEIDGQSARRNNIDKVLPRRQGHVSTRLSCPRSCASFSPRSSLAHSFTATIIMAHFASLPNELICEILRYVKPEDLENFAQASRNVFQLASPFLGEHAL